MKDRNAPQVVSSGAEGNCANRLRAHGVIRIVMGLDVSPKLMLAMFLKIDGETGKDGSGTDV